MSRLTDTQLVILSSAAQRLDGTVLPLPGSLTINKGAVGSVLKSLVRRGLVAEQAAAAGQTVWREDGDDTLTLVITGAGLESVGIDPTEVHPAKPVEPAEDKPTPRQTATAGNRTARPATKQVQLLDLLQRQTGATLGEIGEVTGWQPHSIRGAISGTVKKKLGLAVTSTVEPERGRVYRVAGAA